MNLRVTPIEVHGVLDRAAPEYMRIVGYVEDFEQVALRWDG
jgi:hypothetical protein